MRSRLIFVVALFGFIFTGNAAAWGENGHQTVGAIADNLIQGSNAEAQVKAILGSENGQQLNLQKVSVWADCIRSVQPGKNFQYIIDKYHVQACEVFEDDAGKQAMSDYAKRNNSNCEYSGKNFECHKSFHFADVDI